MRLMIENLVIFIFSSLKTRSILTFVDVDLTTTSAESNRAITSEATLCVHANASMLARTSVLQALVYVDRTVFPFVTLRTGADR